MKSSEAQKRRSLSQKAPVPFSRVLRVLRDIILIAAARETVGEGIDKVRERLEGAFAEIEVEDHVSEDEGED